jgi:hypothetical protein
MNTFDIIIFLMIIAIIVVLVIINVNSVLNDRLSNIAVNIPPITIPEPHITVQVQKSCASNEYDVYIEKNGGTQAAQTVSLSPIHAITSEQIENFDQTVATPTPTPNTNTNNTNNNNNTNTNNNTFDKDKSNVHNVEFPKENNLIPSVTNKPIVTEPVVRKNQCGNVSLQKRRHDAYKYMTHNSKSINNHEFPMCNNQPTIVNKEQKFLSNTDDYETVYTPSDFADINDIHDDENMLENYRKKQQYVKSYLEDPVVRGYNVDGFESSAAFDQIGKIPLDKIVNNPKPFGYIFDSSPIYTR